MFVYVSWIPSMKLTVAFSDLWFEAAIRGIFNVACGRGT